MLNLTAILGGLLTLTGFVSAFTILAATHLAYPGGYLDPFSPYEAMLPGQPVAAISPNACVRSITLGIPYGPVLCKVNPTDAPPFISVTVSVQEGRFDQTRFLAEGLYVGDIVQHWGRPDVIVRGPHIFYVRWEDGLQGLIEPDGPLGEFSYVVPVKWLTVWIESQSVRSG